MAPHAFCTPATGETAKTGHINAALELLSAWAMTMHHTNYQLLMDGYSAEDTIKDMNQNYCKTNHENYEKILVF